MKHLTIIAVVVIALFLSISVSYGQDTVEEGYLKGVEFGAHGKFTEAKKEFEKALKADPFYTPAELGLKVIEDVTGKKIKGESAIHLFKGIMYEEWDKTIAEYNKAIKINPKFAEAYINRGIAYYSKNLYDQAIADFNKAIEINPRYAGAYNNRAISYYYKKEYNKTWDDFYKAQSLGYQVLPEFINELRKASGRQK